MTEQTSSNSCRLTSNCRKCKAELCSTRTLKGGGSPNTITTFRFETPAPGLGSISETEWSRFEAQCVSLLSRVEKSFATSTSDSSAAYDLLAGSPLMNKQFGAQVTALGAARHVSGESIVDEDATIVQQDETNRSCGFCVLPCPPELNPECPKVETLCRTRQRGSYSNITRTPTSAEFEKSSAADRTIDEEFDCRFGPSSEKLSQSSKRTTIQNDLDDCPKRLLLMSHQQHLVLMPVQRKSGAEDESPAGLDEEDPEEEVLQRSRISSHRRSEVLGEEGMEECEEEELGADAPTSGQGIQPTPQQLCSDSKRPSIQKRSSSKSQVRKSSTLFVDKDDADICRLPTPCKEEKIERECKKEIFPKEKCMVTPRMLCKVAKCTKELQQDCEFTEMRGTAEQQTEAEVEGDGDAEAEVEGSGGFSLWFPWVTLLFLGFLYAAYSGLLGEKCKDPAVHPCLDYASVVCNCQYSRLWSSQFGFYSIEHFLYIFISYLIKGLYIEYYFGHMYLAGLTALAVFLVGLLYIPVSYAIANIYCTEALLKGCTLGLTGALLVMLIVLTDRLFDTTGTIIAWILELIPLYLLVINPFPHTVPLHIAGVLAGWLLTIADMNETVCCTTAYAAVVGTRFVQNMNPIACFMSSIAMAWASYLMAPEGLVRLMGLEHRTTESIV